MSPRRNYPAETNRSVLALALVAIVVWPVWFFVSFFYGIKLRDFAENAGAAFILFSGAVWIVGLGLAWQAAQMFFSN